MFYRAPHKSRFTVVDNGILSGDLSLSARGLLATILALPDDWKFCEKGLCEIVPDGRRRVHGALMELEQAGYIVRSSQGRDQSGRMTAQAWDIIESPQVRADAQNVTAGATRQEVNNPQVRTDARNGKAGATRRDRPFPQVRTDARLPLADNVHQLSNKDQIRTIKGGNAAARGAASPSNCPECGERLEQTNTFKSGTKERLYRCPACWFEAFRETS